MNQIEININGRLISKDQPPYIVAELSANHNGSLEYALKNIEMAKKMGADAIKIQTYTADTLTIDVEHDDFQIREGLWKGQSLYSLYQQAQTPYEWHQAMFEHAKKVGITIFSTPFDESAVDLLEDLNTPAYKIASFEAVDLPLIRYVAQTGKPMIISTGMANLEEISEAVEIAKQNGCRELIFLHCISGYHAPVDQSNLHTIPDLERRFKVIMGLSDHTLGTVASVTSVALGACLIEKHVTMSRKNKGPDSAFSLEPEELERLCIETKDAWSALGSVGYERRAIEEENMKFRRSIYAVKDIFEGEIITQENIRRIRPGYGLKPKYFDDVLGKKASKMIKRGTALKWEHVL